MTLTETWCCRAHVELYADIQHFSVRGRCALCAVLRYSPPLTVRVASVVQWGQYSGLSVEAAVDVIVTIAQVWYYRELRTGNRR